jgi:hypothetical protein
MVHQYASQVLGGFAPEPAAGSVEERAPQSNPSVQCASSPVHVSSLLEASIIGVPFSYG